VNTISAISTPPSAAGAEYDDTVVDQLRQLFGQQHDRKHRRDKKERVSSHLPERWLARFAIAIARIDDLFE
jgi:hypothetical protein